MTIFDFLPTSAKQAEILDRIKRLQVMGADILAAQGMIGAQLHEIVVEQVFQRGLLEQILERLTPPLGPDPQQEEIDSMTATIQDVTATLGTSTTDLQTSIDQNKP